MDAIRKIGDQKEQVDKYKEYFVGLVAQKNVAGLIEFVRHMVEEKTHIVVSRQLLSHFSKEAFHDLDVDSSMELASSSVEIMSERLVSFEEPVSVVRELWADILEEEEQYDDAARVLEGIVLDSPHRQVKNHYKVSVLVRIASLWLMEDDYTRAEGKIHKAANMIKDREVRGDAVLNLKYKSCFAQISDFKRKFLDAAAKYYELSHLVPKVEEQQDSLAYSIICACLAEAGPKRSRILAILYKDERATQMKKLFTILEKSYLDQIIRKEEMELFGKELKPHQRGRTKDGFHSLLEWSVIQQNLLAASRLYNNIGFKELGGLLGVTTLEAEQTASKMIAEKRLNGRIDQIDKVIYFQGDTSSLNLWDKHIKIACDAVNAVTDQIGAKYPQYL